MRKEESDLILKFIMQVTALKVAIACHNIIPIDDIEYIDSIESKEDAKEYIDRLMHTYKFK